MESGANEVVIYTDGGCKGNPGPGAWAAVLDFGGREQELVGAAPQTTNNRMELTAAIEALAALPPSSRVRMVTDSQYLKNGITVWLPRWLKNGWRTSQKKPVLNRDLWERLDVLTRRHRVRWDWVPGHAGHPGNERCDQLVTAALAEN